MSNAEHAHRVVEAYTKGIICSGEVFSQYLDHISPETVDAYMALLSPELIQRFKANLGERLEDDYPLTKPEDLERWRRANTLIADWLRRQGLGQDGGGTQA